MTTTTPPRPVNPRAATAVDRKIPIPQALAFAARKIDSGALQEAEILLRQVLEKQPENPHAHHLLGLIAHRVGRSELALEMIGKAIDLLPDFAQFHVNRGEMCRLLKRLDEAIEHGEKAVKLDPKSAAAHSNLGIAYYDKKDYDRAEECQQKALKLEPQLVQSLNNMGSIKRARKESEEAMAFYRQVLEIDPDYHESANNLAALLIEDNQSDEALKLLMRLVKVNPNYAEAHNNIGNAFFAKEEYDKALVAYNRALSLRQGYLEPMLGIARVQKEKEQLDDAALTVKHVLEIDSKRPEAYALLGDIRLKQAKYEESGEAYRKAITLEETLLGAHLGLGQLQMELGELNEAEKTFQQAMEINSDEVAPYVFMTQVSKIKQGDGILARLEQEAGKLQELPEGKAMSLHFAMGKAYDDVKEYDKAFPHFMEGCRIKRGKIDYNPGNNDRSCAEIIRFFKEENLAKLRGGAEPSDLPIFVLGMPRSGTTLVETIIASHPEVFGAGELHDILRIANNPKPGIKSEGFPISMQGLTAADVREMGERYLENLRQHDARASRITDKMPANFMALGLIHLMLPQAKVVHVMRNPVDICLSNFTKNFNNSQLHSYDLSEMARFYVNYAKLMEHWRKVLPQGSFYDIQYEQLVADPEPETRSLIDYCGLSWDDACLSPHKTERGVKTASVTQVRQPVYTDSVERWRRYETFLQPLLDALGDYAPESANK
jgi:tetratricopeptide (TPR) repeat protein